MKLRGLAVLSLSLLLGMMTFTSAKADWDRPVRAWCAGGPAKPSYAFEDADAAERCRQRIASVSGACARDAKAGPCWAERESIDQVDDNYCTCASGTPAVGTW